MAYVQGTDFISDTDLVRQQATNVLPDDFLDADIQTFQYQAYSLIRTITNKDDWISTDREFGALQRIETDLADAYIRKHFKKSYESVAEANSVINSCIAELKDIQQNMDTPTGQEELSITRTSFKSWNLNPDVEVPRGQLIIT